MIYNEVFLLYTQLDSCSGIQTLISYDCIAYLPHFTYVAGNNKVKVVQYTLRLWNSSYAVTEPSQIDGWCDLSQCVLCWSYRPLLTFPSDSRPLDEQVMIFMTDTLSHVILLLKTIELLSRSSAQMLGKVGKILRPTTSSRQRFQPSPASSNILLISVNSKILSSKKGKRIAGDVKMKSNWKKKKKERTTPGIRWSSPTQLLIRRYVA